MIETSGIDAAERRPGDAAAAKTPSRHAQRRFYRSAAHEEALARLLYLAEYGRSSGLVVGPEGSGKTTLLAEAARDLKLSGRKVISLDLAFLDAQALTDQLLRAFRVPGGSRNPAAQLVELLDGYLLSGRTVVVLLDDVDHADASALRLLDRILRTASPESGQLTVLATATDALPAHDLDWIRRGAELRIDLGALAIEEVAGYLAVTSIVDGVTRQYTETAATRLYELTAGNPRRISQIARLAALAAEAGRNEQIDDETVVAVASELPSVLRADDHRG